MVDPNATLTYSEALTAAIADIAEHGYDSEERVQYWAEVIRRAAERSMRSLDEVERAVAAAMTAVYAKQVERRGILRFNPGVTPFTLDRIQPQLRDELNRRIAASVNLIKLNRPQAVMKTMQRFRGWATSVPRGGSADVNRVKQRVEIRKALSQLPFEERRVIIDQNAKLFSSINATVAENGGAIGGFWQSHKFQHGYNGRPAHNARQGDFFLLRHSWARDAGLVKPGKHGYTDEIEQPAELPFCRCWYQYVYSLRSVPEECLTKKGQAALEEARAKVAAMMEG